MRGSRGWPLQPFIRHVISNLERDWMRMIQSQISLRHECVGKNGPLMCRTGKGSVQQYRKVSVRVLA